MWSVSLHTCSHTTRKRKLLLPGFPFGGTWSGRLMDTYSWKVMWDDGVETLTLLSLLRDLPLLWIHEWGALDVPLPCYYWAPYEYCEPSRKSKGTLLSVWKAIGVCTIGLFGSLLHIGLYIALLCLCMNSICVLYGCEHICKEVCIHTCGHIYIDYTCVHRPESDTRWLSASPWCMRKSLSLNLELTQLAGWLAELQGSVCPHLPRTGMPTSLILHEHQGLNAGPYLYLVRTYCPSHLSHPSITLEASQLFLLSLPAGTWPDRLLFSQPLFTLGELRSFKQQAF